MTTGIPSVLDGFLGDEPFDLDWRDVCERSKRINTDGSERPVRNRRGVIKVRWRIVIAAAIVIAAVAIPLTALAFGLVFSSPPPTVALVQSGPIEIRVPKGFSSAGGSRAVRIAGRRRQVSIVIAADFPLRPPLNIQAPPRPGADRFVISITHFPASGPARQWPNVKTLHFPEQPGKTAVLRARVDAEALLTKVRFGSIPTREQVASVNAFLAGIRNNQN
jgi:hypothetical protein